MWNLGTNSAFALGLRKTSENLQSQSHVTTDGQSVGMYWCQVHSGTCGQILFCLQVAVLSLRGALSDKRSGLSPVSHCQQYLVHCQKLNIIYILCHMFYVYAIYTRPLSAQAQYSRSCQNICSLCYNSSLDTVHLTTTKFNRLHLALYYGHLHFHDSV
jgi:hypothetical protein